MNNMLLRRRIMLGLASSPFSPEATAILKEDFPNEWNDIKAYGYANREIVPYINEDPYIVVSLGLISGVSRRLFTNYYTSGKGGYINPNFKFASRNTKIETEVEWISLADSRLCGIFSQTGNLVNNIISSGSSNTFESNGKAVSYSFGLNAIYKIEYITSSGNMTVNITVNGNTTTLSATGLNNFTLDNYFCIFGLNWVTTDGDFKGWGGLSNVKIPYFKIYDSNVLLRHLIPYISSTNGVGMLDIHDSSNLTFYPETHKGTYDDNRFIIEYTGRPYLNITSTAKTYIINTYGESAWNTVKEFFIDPATESLVTAVNSDPTVVEELCGINGGELRSLKSNDKAYIDTNYVISENDEIEIEFTLDNITPSSGRYLYGVGNTTMGDGFVSSHVTSNSKILNYFGGQASTAGVDFSIGSTGNYKLNNKKTIASLYKNNVLQETITIPYNTLTSLPLRIFGLNRQNTTVHNTENIFDIGTIKSFTIKKNGLYTMYLIPRIVNNRAGFLNLVTNTMLYNNDSNVGSSLSIVTEQNS